MEAGTHPGASDYDAVVRLKPFSDAPGCVWKGPGSLSDSGLFTGSMLP